MSIVPKLIYRFNAILIEIPAGFFCRCRLMILKCTWKSKGTRTVKIILKRKNKIGGLTWIFRITIKLQ